MAFSPGKSKPFGKCALYYTKALKKKQAFFTTFSKKLEISLKKRSFSAQNQKTRSNERVFFCATVFLFFSFFFQEKEERNKEESKV
ncbi:MAG: hypothetical protein J6J21_01170 [Clostridia bacterium]|nr:hypothetical protein [Clostridia bacterium]